MKIALVFPKSTFLTDSMVWPPLGLWYIGAQLEAQGHKTDFFDLSIHNLPEDGEYDQLWISATAPQMFEVRKVSEITTNWHRTVTVIGGSAPWANPQTCLELPFDLVVVGEGDHPDTIKNIIWLLGGETHSKLYQPPIRKDLDWVLPPIRRWSKDYHAYMKDQEGKLHRMATLFTSRGCPMSCSFCESGRRGVIWGTGTRYEPLWSVERQIEEIKSLGFTGLAYYDDVFILNKKRTYKLLDLHKKHGMVFRCFLRSDILCNHGGKDYLKAMQDAGLIEVFVGVESADDQIKRNIHKGTTIAQDTKVLEWCRELGIRCKMSFIFGLPGESLESMKKTRTWIREHRPDIVQVDRLVPFPGTPLTKHPEDYDLNYEEQIEEEWFFRGREDLNSRSFVSTSNLSRDEIDQFWREFEAELVADGLSGYNH